MSSQMIWTQELLTLKSKIAIILAGTIDVDLQQQLTGFNYIIAVDGGLNHLTKAGIKPDILIGDLDSVTSQFDGQTLKFDPIKDDTDFKCAIKYVEQNFANVQIDVYGFNSLDRLDHVIANLANITSNIKLISDNQQIYLINHDTVVEGDEYKYYSFFSTEVINQFSLEGFKYPLSDYQLKPFDPLCVSNQLINNSGTIRISNGQLLVIKSKNN